MTITIESGITIQDGIVIGNLPIVKPGISHTVAANGNARVSTSVVKFGTGSYTSNSLNGYLRVTPFSDFAFGTKDFTIECWYYPTSDLGGVLLGLRPLNTQGAYPVIVIDPSYSPCYYTNTAYRIRSPNNSTTLNQWSSLAVVRYQGVTKLYVDGVQAGSAYVDNNNYLAGSCIIGASDFNQTGIYPNKGNLDEIRFSNIARYTANYTPQTQPFVTDQNTLLLIHCDGANNSTVFTDVSNVV
jgi:hypothetical protein